MRRPAIRAKGVRGRARVGRTADGGNNRDAIGAGGDGLRRVGAGYTADGDDRTP